MKKKMTVDPTVEAILRLLPRKRPVKYRPNRDLSKCGSATDKECM